ncbi:hypothetical protein L596_010511 [Steinernema carpocapsae]|uniref:C-type lectin domain-containing protein n=1 Tax=Steinernema carpocapsae TaxID=34508 RepID=A0A4U5PJ34_STECR|nr:hypothetical protein L596_010511 [Steinernema carpocapsae]
MSSRKLNLKLFCIWLAVTCVVLLWIFVVLALLWPRSCAIFAVLISCRIVSNRPTESTTLVPLSTFTNQSSDINPMMTLLSNTSETPTAMFSTTVNPTDPTLPTVTFLATLVTTSSTSTEHTTTSSKTTSANTEIPTTMFLTSMLTTAIPTEERTTFPTTTATSTTMEVPLTTILTADEPTITRTTDASSVTTTSSRLLITLLSALTTKTKTSPTTMTSAEASTFTTLTFLLTTGTPTDEPTSSVSTTATTTTLLSSSTVTEEPTTTATTTEAIPVPATSPNPMCSPPPCPSGTCSYTCDQDPSTNFCYRAMHNHDKNWTQSETLCQSYGAHLASISNLDENAFLVQLAEESVGKGKVQNNAWIGYTSSKNKNQYMWSDGCTFNYTNWAPREPNNRGTEHCAELYIEDTKKKAKWNDNFCGFKKTILCKKSAKIQAEN